MTVRIRKTRMMTPSPRTSTKLSPGQYLFAGLDTLMNKFAFVVVKSLIDKVNWIGLLRSHCTCKQTRYPLVCSGIHDNFDDEC